MKKVTALKITQKQGLDMKAKLLNSIRTLFFADISVKENIKLGKKHGSKQLLTQLRQNLKSRNSEPHTFEDTS